MMLLTVNWNPCNPLASGFEMPISPRVNPLGKPELGFKPYFGKVGNTGGIKYFKCSKLCKFVNIRTCYKCDYVLYTEVNELNKAID